MKLITEQIESVEFVTEEKNGKKSHFIEGIFLQGNLKNRNNRVYPVHILEREVNKYVAEHIQNDRAVGELGHPDGPTVNLDRVSHKILSLKKEGDNFIGKAKLLGTPMGVIAKNLLDEGVRLGVSSRGLGTLDKREDANYVRDDFMLATAADIVADPSAPDAFVNGIFEGKEWVWQNGIVKESRVASYKRHLSRSEQRDLDTRKIAVFKDFLGTL
tara:strand:- start:796 stop:1440 length:645 start_codon:yes stop_codon:yes gene_type:complete